jgi:hypothetical protein
MPCVQLPSQRLGRWCSCSCRCQARGVSATLQQVQRALARSCSAGGAASSDRRRARRMSMVVWSTSSSSLKQLSIAPLAVGRLDAVDRRAVHRRQCTPARQAGLRARVVDPQLPHSIGRVLIALCPLCQQLRALASWPTGSCSAAAPLRGSFLPSRRSVIARQNAARAPHCSQGAPTAARVQSSLLGHAVDEVVRAVGGQSARVSSSASRPSTALVGVARVAQWVAQLRKRRSGASPRQRPALNQLACLVEQAPRGLAQQRPSAS